MREEVHKKGAGDEDEKKLEKDESKGKKIEIVERKKQKYKKGKM